MAHSSASTQQFVWHLSLLGYRTVDVLRHLSAVAAGRRVLLFRVAVVASLLVVLCQDQLAFTIQFGAPSANASAASAQPQAMQQAGLFGAAAAATPVRQALSDDEALALIERFGHVAAAEQANYGVDAGILLAAAIVAGNTARPTNSFGAALDGSFATAWESWRTMSLTVLAETGGQTPATPEAWATTVASLYPNAKQVRADILYAARRYSL